jgi:hypothetical protein
MLRTRSLKIAGELPLKLARQVKAAIASHSPPIAKLRLVNVGEAGDMILFSSQLSVQRDLSCSSRSNAEIMKSVASNPSLAGLRSLDLAGGPVHAASLAAALAHLAALQTLSLHYFEISGPSARSNVLENALNRLETVELDHCMGIEKIPPLGANGPLLPALRHLKLVKPTSRDVVLEPRPWLAHLESLYVEGSVTSCGVVATLSGGPLCGG